jgi:pimeloyl-ACP methyl ester carboxylesterase
VSQLAVAGTTLAYRLHGTGSPKITLVHGGLVASPSWRFQLPDPGGGLQGLAAAGQVIAHDQRGYGATPWGEGLSADAGFAPLADDLLALWDVLEVERTVVVGFSMGTMVALEAAARAPERVAGLVLVSGGALDDEGRAVFEARAAEIEGGDFEAQIGDHVRRAFSPAYVSDHPALIDEYAGAARTADPRAVAHTFRSIAAWQPPDLEALSAPTLLLNGSLDRLFTPAAARVLAYAMPPGLDARCEVVEGAGHTLHFEQPELFNARLERFVAEEANR